MKRIVLICTCFLLLHSCVLNEEINQVMPEVASRSITIHQLSHAETSEIPEEAFANVHVRIHNKMSDLHLKVQSIELCNIHQSATFHFPTDYQESRWTLQESQTDFPIHNDSLEIAPMDAVSLTQENGIPFIPQTLQAWNPSIHPSKSKDCYIHIMCQIQQYSNHTPLQVAIPLSMHLLPGQAETIDITLEIGGSWYEISDTIPARLFVPITFSPSVEDWVDITR